MTNGLLAILNCHLTTTGSFFDLDPMSLGLDKLKMWRPQTLPRYSINTFVLWTSHATSRISLRHLQLRAIRAVPIRHVDAHV